MTYFGDGCFAACSALEAIDIPSSVTRLGDLCFDGCSTLEEIEIPSSVTELGEYCFQECKALKTAKIPFSVNSIGNYCFKECTSLETVTCEIPTAIEGEFFTDSPIEQATLYVPIASLESYKTTSDWNRFGTILPISSTGINNNTTVKPVTIDAIYNLDGKRSNGTSRGMNIIRMTDGTTRKVMK
ncbi:MAG: leucine-rich repeat domain-containing protein [Agathobacter sp.]